MPSRIFSKGTVGQKAQGVMETSKFFTHPTRNSCNSSRNVYSYDRCYIQVLEIFFQMVTRMLAHSLRKAHIKFYLFSILKYWKQLPRDTGWWWQGSSPWFHATTSPHVQSTAGCVRGSALRSINQLSLGYRAPVCPLGVTQWSNTVRWPGAPDRRKEPLLKITITRALLIYILENWKYTLQRWTFLPGQNTAP